MDFFDLQRWRITNTDASKHLRSLFGKESTAVASSALAETATAHALALVSSRLEKTVKEKMSSMRSFDPTYSDQRAMHRLRSLPQRYSSGCYAEFHIATLPGESHRTTFRPGSRRGRVLSRRESRRRVRKFRGYRGKCDRSGRRASQWMDGYHEAIALVEKAGQAVFLEFRCAPCITTRFHRALRMISSSAPSNPKAILCFGVGRPR